MNTTANIASRLTLLANNAIDNSSYKRLCIEAADRLNVLYNALGSLIEDSERADHNCGDLYCPIMIARQVYCLGGE